MNTVNTGTSTVTINTVQGIGDIFWVYQKLAPYVDAIELNIMCTKPENIIQRRSLEFCTMLPKVKRTRFVKCTVTDYAKLAQGRFEVMPVVRARQGRVSNYAVNGALEAGVNLLDVDPGTLVESFVDLGLAGEVEREDYLCVFVAGAKTGQVWPWPRWISVILRLAARLETDHVVLIGASWDNQVADPIAADLSRKGMRVRSFVGTTGLADTVEIIRRSRYFLGYQSGLNVLAENYNVPQLMVYFAKLRRMMYTWAKADGVGTRFHATTFADDVLATVESLPLFPKAVERYPSESTVAFDQLG